MTNPDDNPISRILYGQSATICCVSARQSLKSRRRLSTKDRKRIASYYAKEEQQEIRTAADKLRVSLSGFVAGAALKEARRVNSEQTPRRS